MKNQEMTVEERKAAIAELNSRQAMLQSKIDIAKDAEEAVENQKREHRLAIEDKASQIVAEAFPTKMPNAGKITVRVSDYWAPGMSNGASIKISRSDSRSHDFDVVILDGKLHRYSAYSQSGDANDAQETIAYYEMVSTLLSFVCNPANKDMLLQVCEIVNVPYSEAAETVTPNLSNLQTEMCEINDEIRKLQVYVGAKGFFKRGKDQIDIIIVKVTPKRFYYQYVLDSRNSETWDDCVAIGDRRFTFAELAE